MKFTTFAYVTSPDDPLGGVGGYLLKDLIADNDGQYVHRYILPDRTKERLRKFAEATSSPALAEIADRPVIYISFEHLRGLDPETTRVRIGSEVRRESGDPSINGLDR